MNDKLYLAEEGVFPITKSAEGKVLKTPPATGIAVAGTIQGEGKLLGTPSIFIRLAGCNLRCVWMQDDGNVSICDTPYASFDTGGASYKGICEIVNTVWHNLGNMRHVVITGGEPTLQLKPLINLCEKLKDKLGVHITMESNGTLFDENLAALIDFFSISPKLSDTVAISEKMEKLSESKFALSASSIIYKPVSPEIVQAYIDICSKFPQKKIQLKFVLSGEESARKAEEEVLSKIKGWEPSDILAMPLGESMDVIDKTTPKVLEAAIKRGWRFTPRLHINLFGKGHGV